MGAKAVPVRMCSGCSAHLPKNELIRIVRTPAGEIALDLGGRLPGRGAYLCRRAECLKKARKSRRIERVLGCVIPPEVYDRIEGELAAHG